MFKKLIWPTKATPTQDRSEQIVLKLINEGLRAFIKFTANPDQVLRL